MARFAMSKREGGIPGALCRKYSDPEYAIFFEVHDKIGGHNASADAIAMGLWKSRGQDLHGFEIKNHRSDWLRELKDPAKAEQISVYCDYWWLVTSDDKVAKPEEIPSKWGLMVLTGRGLRVEKQAPRLDAMPMSRQFLAALLRRGHEDVMSDSRVRAAIERAREEGRARAEGSAEHSVTCAQRERDYFKRAIDDFEKASGIKISHYDAGYMGEAVQFLRQMNKNVREKESLLGRIASVRSVLEGQLHELLRAQTGLEKAFAEMDKRQTVSSPQQDTVDPRGDLLRGPGTATSCGVDDAGSRQSS